MGASISVMKTISGAVPVAVVAGLRAEPVAAVVDGLLARVDRVAALSYRVTPADGLVRGVRDSDGRQAREPLPAGCPAGAMLADGVGMLRLLARSGRYDTIVLQLAGSWDPDAVLAGLTGTGRDPLADVARLDTVVTVADAATLLDDLDSTDTLAVRQLALAVTDRRTIAPVLARQIETADTVLLLDGPDRQHPSVALVDRLVPHATVLTPGDPCDVPLLAVLGTGRFDPGRSDAFADTGPLDPRRTGTVERNGIGSVRFEARRPFHPARLHSVLPDLVDEAVRGSGRLWLATRPDCVVWFDLAGGTVTMQPVARWLDAPGGSRTHRPGPYQLRTAHRVWDPYYGDRAQHLAFTGPGLDPDRVTTLLRGCLLADGELGLGPDEWRTFPDPVTAAAKQPGTGPRTQHETGEAS